MKQDNAAKQHVNILLVDDYEMFRRGIRLTLETLASPFRFNITEEENPEALTAIISQHQFDLIILDDKLPGSSICQLITHIKTQQPSTRILAISVYNDPISMKNIIAAGADGYILKNVDTTQLIQAITSLLKGEKFYSGEVTAKLIEVEKENARIKSLYEHYGLTLREIEVLRLIAKEQTNDDISKQLFISKRTVDTHRQNLLHKLQAKNTAGLVIAAMQLKLV
ncbi:MAG TPA: response regulator transcription factor [Chitinophagaceae bacterium]|nr:response regulator transcription factor [Chitinophagaceae bacterium]